MTHIWTVSQWGITMGMFLDEREMQLFADEPDNFEIAADDDEDGAIIDVYIEKHTLGPNTEKVASYEITHKVANMTEQLHTLEVRVAMPHGLSKVTGLTTLEIAQFIPLLRRVFSDVTVSSISYPDKEDEA